MSNLRQQLQKNWLHDVLPEHPEIINDSTSPEEVYSALWELWLVDIQAAMKELIRDVMPEIDRGE